MVHSHIFHSSLFHIQVFPAFGLSDQDYFVTTWHFTATFSESLFLYLSTTLRFLSDKRPFFVVSPSLSLTAFTRRESTFSINTCNYIWQLPNLNWFNFTTRFYKNKKHSSRSSVSFRMISLLRFPLFFRAYQEISAYKVVIYMKSSGNSQTQLFENILLSHGVKSELPWKSGLV